MSAAGQNDAPVQPPDRGLSRRQRITGTIAFQRAFTGGRRYAGRLMVMRLTDTEEPGLRLGVVAGRKSFHEAVMRNRAKRLLREAYRVNRWRLKPGQDVILMAREPLLQASLKEIEGELLGLAGRAGILAVGAEGTSVK